MSTSTFTQLLSSVAVCLSLSLALSLSGHFLSLNLTIYFGPLGQKSHVAYVSTKCY